MNNNNRKPIIIALCIAVAFAILSIIARNISEEAEIYGKTLRLHVLANSDSEEDQNLKLAVKDAVILRISDDLSLCKTKEEAEKVIMENKEELEETANRILIDAGKEPTAKLTLTKEQYPERTYGNLTLPAGEYSSVRILLGEAEGQNWWCVLFPQVCTETATPVEETLAQAGFTSAQIRLLTDQEKPTYKIKFKVVELFGSLFAKN
jgi:stage II sporulation protein R